MQPDEFSEDRTGTINKTVTSILDITHLSKTITSCATLQTYEETPIFIPLNITEEPVESVAQKRLGSSGPGGTESEELQGWLLQFGEDSTRLRTSVETSVYWLANCIPPWAAYCEFMSVRLIALDKQPGVRPVGVGETWWSIFANIVLKITGPEATMACQDDQMCAGIRVVIDGVIHRVQALWDKKSTMEDWGFLLVDAKNTLNEINRVGMLWTVRHLWLSGAHLVFNCYRHW